MTFSLTHRETGGNLSTLLSRQKCKHGINYCNSMRLAIPEDVIFLSFSQDLKRNFAARWEIKSLYKENQSNNKNN